MPKQRLLGWKNWVKVNKMIPTCDTFVIPQEEYNALLKELAAGQAREKVLRDALFHTQSGGCTCLTKTPDPRFHADHCGYKIAAIALAQPTDDAALKAALAAERERCAKEADRQLEDEPYGHARFRCANIAAEIRALGD